eukprot:CAMPEP_0118933626 /NCGR_PEP_ID=MMETSP1169-20130426/12088_1 /TAXON_ID=36882 /ORGANISM="Pyramimonas obovata, Strain CCMP722" /LENGTH=499 /DNA_ID=CAMNT_0006876409 /DNA_START=128 /DNA_END=1629 /DNA_ORIENTATION=+
MASNLDEIKWAELQCPDELKKLVKDMNQVDGKGRTAFYNICRRCPGEVVEEALKLGGKHDQGGKKGKLPLFGACRTQNIAAVKLLLAAGANPDAPTESGFVPLWVSARDGMTEVVEELVGKGADPNWVEERTNTNCLMVACSEGNEATALACLSGTREYEVAQVETEGSTALWVAASEGYSEVVTSMLNLGADPNQPNNYQRTPLMAAALQGHAATCEILITNGADATLADENGETALYMASNNGHAGVVEVILKSAGPEYVNQGNAEGETPLIAAAWNGHTDVVELLLGKGAEVDKQNEGGRTPIIAACWKSNPEVAKALLAAGGNVHKLDEHGRSALWAAARGGCEKCVQVVLENGGDSDQMDNRQGAFDAGAGVSSCTPLFAATWQGHVAAVECLLTSGADPELGDNENRKPVDVTDNDEIKALLTKYTEIKYDDKAEKPAPAKGKGTQPKTEERRPSDEPWMNGAGSVKAAVPNIRPRGVPLSDDTPKTQAALAN